jgi:hypothetical protein
MKRRVFVFFTCLTLWRTAGAQSDIQAMLKQIALLEIHIEELKNAIDIARDGLTTISEIKNGEFNLHSIFFSSLQRVNPSVAKYSKIAEIIEDQIAIVSDFKALLKRMNGSARISNSDIVYVNTVYSNISRECSKSLNDLIAVTTDGNLKMTDDERVKRINGIYLDMKDKYAFTQKFTIESGKLITERDRAFNETQFLKSLE